MAWKFLFILLFSVFYLASLSSASFVCGEVLSTDEVSSSWMKVLVYYDENVSDTTSCQVNPDSKFCCDLELIESVNWTIGKKVYSEVYDLDTGYASSVSELITSDESYDLFSPILISEVFSFEHEHPTFVIGEDMFSNNLRLNEQYESVFLTVVNENGVDEMELCRDCDSVDMFVHLAKGKNQILITAQNEKRFVHNFTVYSLDYLNVERSFDCPTCYNEHYFYIPSDSEVKVTLSIESSHPIFGTFEEYIPKGFESSESLSSYSDSHNFFGFFVDSDGVFTKEYTLYSPQKILQRKYDFYYSFENMFELDKTYLKVFFWLNLPLFFDYTFSEENYLDDIPFQYSKINEPLIIDVEHEYVDLIAVYPKREGYYKGSLFVNGPSLFSSSQEFVPYSNVKSDNIESILVQLSVPKDENIGLEQHDVPVSLEKYREDEHTEYFHAILDELDTFYVKD